jgi:hypothetical protein
LDWWGRQDPEIMEEALGDKDRISLDAMIKTINKWSVGVDVFWCQGPLFDYAILQNLYTQLGHPQPWQYWQIRDSRTLFSLVPRETEKRVGTTQRTRRLLLPGPESSKGLQTTGNKE